MAKQKNTATSRTTATAKAVEPVVEPVIETVVETVTKVTETVEPVVEEKSEPVVETEPEVVTPEVEAPAAKTQADEELATLANQLKTFEMGFHTEDKVLEYGALVLALVKRAVAAHTDAEVLACYDAFVNCKYSTSYVHNAMAFDPTITRKLAKKIAVVTATMDMRNKAYQRKVKIAMNVDNIRQELSGPIAKFLLS